MRKTAVFIHGGHTHDSYEGYISCLKKCEYDPTEPKRKRWKDALEEEFNEYGIRTFIPAMPCKQNAKYAEWTIWFEKLFPYLENSEVVLIGHSLGGIFLAKYLSEHDFPTKIVATHLVAAPFEKTGAQSEDSFDDFVLPDSLESFEKQGGDITFYHSKDDVIVPFDHIEKYANMLPRAEKIVFDDRGHFLQETFPEIIERVSRAW